MEQNTKDKRNQWHPAFYSAMHLEFRENKEDLEFTEELILNTLPLRVDLLIVKKNHPCIIKNEIGKMFKKHNLIEYKSPDDSLNYDVFLKGIAYAYLYKSNEKYVDEILLEEVTLSFVRQRKPLKLLEKLENEKFHIEEKQDGIYYISKEGFIQMQLIVLKEISQKNHVWLSSLCEKISREQIAKLLERTRKLNELDDKNHADSLWEIVGTVNKDIISGVKEEEQLYRVLAEIMKPEIDVMVKEAVEEGFNNGFNNGFNDGDGNGRMKVFKNMIKDGMPRELAQKYAEISDELAEKVMSEL